MKKIVSKIKEKTSGLKTVPSGIRFNKVFFFNAATILIFILIFFMLMGRFVFGKDGRIKAALENAQRLEIALETGEIKGKVLKADAKSAEEKPSDENAKTTDSKEESAAKPEEEKSAENTDAAVDSSGKPDWTTKDFIGPRLPDEIINSLFGIGNTTNSNIAVSRVSIKDISQKPVVVIIVKGIGLSSSSTREALELPKEITMGLSPYSPSLEVWVKEIEKGKHEFILNIPMETSDYHTDNPGPYSLLTQSSDEDNATRLKMLLGLTKGYSAIYTESSEIFTRSSSNVKPILDLLQKENKYLVYGGGYSNYSMIQVADSISYPILVNDLVLDDDISAAAITDKFKEMEKIATDKGYVVVMAHPYPITIRMLKGWLAKVPEKNIVVSPVSLLLGKVFKENK